MARSDGAGRPARARRPGPKLLDLDPTPPAILEVSAAARPRFTDEDRFELRLVVLPATSRRPASMTRFFPAVPIRFPRPR